MGLIVRVVAGQDAGRTFAIPPEGAVIGRGERATIALADAILSRQHARIVAQGDGATITDLDSANGTQLNGQPLHGTTSLRPGDIIEVGASKLRLELGGDATQVDDRRVVPPEVRQQETIRRADEPTSTAPAAPIGGGIALGATLNGRYRLDRLAGKGGFAQVFVAYDLELHRSIALKVMHANLQEAEGGKDLLARFQREARAVAALNHGNILPIWDYGHVDGAPYLVMPYIEGGSLHDRIRQGPQPDLPQIGEWLRQIAAALDYAHARKIVHRDIKPQNMLLNVEDGRLLLADFGIAKVITEAGSQNATGVIGTLSYMAPEQLRGQVGTGVDIYALGCVLFQLLTGKLPFSGTTEQVMLGHFQDPVPQLRALSAAALPASLQAVIERALAKHPEDRFPTAGALASAYMAAIVASSVKNETIRRLDHHEVRTEIVDEKHIRHRELDVTVVRDRDPELNVINRVDERDVKKARLSRRTFLIAGAASGVTALACVGGVFALAAAGGRGEATPTAGLAAVAPSPTAAPPTATVVAIPTATALPPTATIVPPTATIAPTATSARPTPTNTPTPRPAVPTLRPAVGDEVLTAWEPLSGAGHSAAYNAALGGYRMTLDTAGLGLAQYAPSKSFYTNFELIVDCHLTETSKRGLYGLLFHASPSQSGTAVTGYRLLLSETGYWTLDYVNANNTLTTVKTYTALSEFNAPTKTVRLTVSSKNRALVLSINGTTVGTFEAAAPASGWIGLYAQNYAESGGVDAVFTNLRITKL